jgi:hypothetical protein
MTASEAYKLLRSVVGPWYKRNGFRLARGYLTYQKPLGGRHFNVRWQCNSHGWDKHKGSSFAVFVGFTDDEDADCAPLQRLTEYLTPEQLELVRARQNRVLASIPQPPPEHIGMMVAAFEKSFRDPQPYIDIYLEGWRPVTRPYIRADDIWFRYFSQAHVRAWAILLQQYVEGVHDATIRSSPA